MSLLSGVPDSLARNFRVLRVRGEGTRSEKGDGGRTGVGLRDRESGGRATDRGERGNMVLEERKVNEGD